MTQLFSLILQECKDNYTDTSNKMKLVHWPLMGGMLLYSENGTGWAAACPERSLLYQT